ncbi:hypothetical protein ACHAXA_008479 [Cyclostephanos tholiformis]|uniref:Nudix hydrolase domain-containing protein n=1 Tax=Cyclostephanos tholiformis TaxID=382380 RepID=A0ABD3SBN5_9STRA
MVLGGIISSARGSSSLNVNRLRRIKSASPTGGVMNTSKGVFDMTSSSSSSSSSSSGPTVTDDDGRRWRPCAAAAVLNSKNEMLVGERLGRPGSWQAPQGGINADESVVDAAARELYEEVGLEIGRDILLEEGGGGGPNIVKCRYETEGTGSWLEREGYAGQELRWIVFRCASSMLEIDPVFACDLSGMNGEGPEFASVKWESLDYVVDNVWEGKVVPYRMLKERCVPFVTTRWEGRCANLDLGGWWSRDGTRSVGVVEALVARGLTSEDARRKASEPYVQSWRRHESCRGDWIVATYHDDDAGDNDRPRRELHYPIGEFLESYEGTSTIFGSSGSDGGGGGVVKRRCFYLAESDADDGIAHVTVSETPLGREESLRYVKNGELVLRRTFWRVIAATGTPSSYETDGVVSTEVFVKSQTKI